MKQIKTDIIDINGRPIYFGDIALIKGVATISQELFVCSWCDHYKMWDWSNGWDGFVHSDLANVCEDFTLEAVASFLDSSPLPKMDINFCTITEYLPTGVHITNMRVLQRHYDEYLTYRRYC